MMWGELRLTVRYAETDQMGIVHHSNYAVWFEAGRTAFMKSRGMGYADIEQKGVLMPLYALSCRFLSPARYGEDVLIRSAVKHISRVRAGFCYEVRSAETNRILATGETMHAWTDRALKPINAEKAIPEIYAVLREAAAPAQEKQAGQ